MRFFCVLTTIIVLVVACNVFGQPPAPPPTQTAPEKTGSGISGPGTPFSPTGPVYSQRARSDSPAVQDDLIPSIKPLMDLHMRDTSICLGGDGNYYMTGSTGDNVWIFNDGIELWRSPDLNKWEYLGLVWSFDKDGTWQKTHETGKYGRAVWGPEIHYIKKNYYLTMSMPPGDRGLLKSTTGKPEGPYVNALADDAKLPGEIDASLFEDDDGKVYLLSSSCALARMKDDLSGLAEEMQTPKLLDPDTDPAHHGTTCPEKRKCEDIGREGPFLFKRDGKYYLTCADTYDGRYSSMAAISDNVYGPYKMRHEAVPCAGRSCYFKDKKGDWWCTFFGNDNQAPWREMPGIIRVEFGTDGKIHPTKQ